MPGISAATDRSPASTFFAITPNDSTNLAAATRAIMVGVSGDVKILGLDDTVGVVLPALAAGVWHQCQAKRVYSTGTTATTIVGCG